MITTMYRPLEAGRRAWSLDTGELCSADRVEELAVGLNRHHSCSFSPWAKYRLPNGPASFLHRVYIHSVGVVLPKFHVNRAE